MAFSTNYGKNGDLLRRDHVGEVPSYVCLMLDICGRKIPFNIQAYQAIAGLKSTCPQAKVNNHVAINANLKIKHSRLDEDANPGLQLYALMLYQLTALLDLSKLAHEFVRVTQLVEHQHVELETRVRIMVQARIFKEKNIL